MCRFLHVQWDFIELQEMTSEAASNSVFTEKYASVYSEDKFPCYSFMFQLACSPRTDLSLGQSLTLHSSKHTFGCLANTDSKLRYIWTTTTKKKEHKSPPINQNKIQPNNNKTPTTTTKMTNQLKKQS